MTLKVLIVDDSSFFRRQIERMLRTDPQIECLEPAVDGKDAIEKTLRLKPDVITMDIEMPTINGIEATREIMRQRPTPILMFSSLTVEGAKATLDAMAAGAIDFMPKRFEDITKNKEEAGKILCERVKAIAGQRAATAQIQVARALPQPKPKRVERNEARPNIRASEPPTPVVKNEPVVPYQRSGTRTYSVVAIGTSTGGPVALQAVLTKIPKNFPVPIILIQHMPGSFTGAFAQRLDDICEIDVKEAADGDLLQPGHAYLAPGGKQMTIKKRGAQFFIQITEASENQTYKPSVDVTFNSVAECYGSGALALVLTGMGADGREGSRQLKKGGSTVWAQNESTCVVYGMPSAVVGAGLADRILALPEIGEAITKEV